MEHILIAAQRKFIGLTLDIGFSSAKSTSGVEAALEIAGKYKATEANVNVKRAVEEIMQSSSANIVASAYGTKLPTIPLGEIATKDLSGWIQQVYEGLSKLTALPEESSPLIGEITLYPYSMLADIEPTFYPDAVEEMYKKYARLDAKRTGLEYIVNELDRPDRGAFEYVSVAREQALRGNLDDVVTSIKNIETLYKEAVAEEAEITSDQLDKVNEPKVDWPVIFIDQLQISGTPHDTPGGRSSNVLMRIRGGSFSSIEFQYPAPYHIYNKPTPFKLLKYYKLYGPVGQPSGSFDQWGDKDYFEILRRTPDEIEFWAKLDEWGYNVDDLPNWTVRLVNQNNLVAVTTKLARTLGNRRIMPYGSDEEKSLNPEEAKRTQSDIIKKSLDDYSRYAEVVLVPDKPSTSEPIPQEKERAVC